MLGIIILATIVVSAISLIGIFLVFKKDETAPEFLKSLISLAAGALLTVSFLDLLPEALEHSTYKPTSILTVTFAGIITFFLVERALHWHHCHCERKLDKTTIAYTNLFGDGLHNFVDGALIASSFLLDFRLGLITTGAVILHEIPQEISDFGILLYAGFSKTKAIIFNFIFALTAVIGAIAFFYFGKAVDGAIPIMAAFAAGNFIYLATADLIPELHHEKSTKYIIQHTAWLLVGVVIFSLLSLFHFHG